MGSMSSKDSIDDDMKSYVNQVINEYTDIMNRDGLFYNKQSWVLFNYEYIKYIDLIDKNDILREIINDPSFLGNINLLQRLEALDDIEINKIKTIVDDAYKRNIIDRDYDYILMRFTESQPSVAPPSAPSESVTVSDPNSEQASN